ncbi:MAG: GMC family oxidoreductase [Acidobacteriaceae bacterium]|nr:GMC family oxidoreductase [Acidobacteriaceae bacterium]MBV9781028.1 GMC family oxidoreductase [Acidobacteriaceae bacterium]
MFQDSLTRTYDAIVVGSGATGGWAAKRLSEAGLSVALLEAGRSVSPKEFTEHMPEFHLKYRNVSLDWLKSRPVQKQCYACMEYNYDWFVDDLQNPYSTPPDKPFTWQRLRILGGRTLVWGRQSYRMSDLDFKAASHDGYGSDWPFSYKDLAPYYDQVEDYVGISGAAESNDALPDGHFLPPMKMTCGELHLRERVQKQFGRTVTIGRTAILTKNHNGRAACHYCGPCERGCSTFSYFSSPFTTVKDAVNTGKCTVITNAVVARVDMDAGTNRATGVTFVDAITRQTKGVRGKTVVLCAQAMESTRILLNSSTREHSAGLGNSSGLLGRGLMDHSTGAGADGELPGFDTKPAPYSGPHRANGIYVIRFRNLEKGPQHPRFIRGYGFQGSAIPEFNFHAQGYGLSFKQAVKSGIYGISLGAFGESLARDDNFVSIDPELKDAWGIPALHISMTHGDNEKALHEDAAETAAEMLEAAGAKNVRIQSTVAEPGMAIHELGTARMGADPKKSVTGPFCQLHDVQNIFAMDGACWVSSGCQNPTLTMMAITVRACDHLIERFRRGEV